MLRIRAGMRMEQGLWSGTDRPDWDSSLTSECLVNLFLTRDNHCRHCGEGPPLLLPQTLPSNPSPPSAICIYCSENRDYREALIMPPLETFLMPQAGPGISSPGPWLPGKASMPGEGPWDSQVPFPKTSLRVSQDPG